MGHKEVVEKGSWSINRVNVNEISERGEKIKIKKNNKKKVIVCLVLRN
jgi:hypothetical protein